LTPAITALKRQGTSYIVRRYDVANSDGRTYGESVAEAIDMPPERVFKTLIAELETNELVVAVVPVCRSLDLRALAAVAHGKKAAMAASTKAEKATGYVKGGISPLGQRRRLRTFVDVSARNHDSICVSAGRRGLQLEIAPTDLVVHTSAVEGELAR